MPRSSNVTNSSSISLNEQGWPRPIEDFVEFAREDAEFVLLHELLRRFREVRFAGPPVETLRGPRIKVYTAACPVDRRHRIRIEQKDGGASIECPDCSATDAGHARLGHALSKKSAYPIDDAHAP